MTQATVYTGNGWFTVLSRKQRQDLARKNKGEYEHAHRRPRRHWWKKTGALSHHHSTPHSSHNSMPGNHKKTNSILGNGYLGKPFHHHFARPGHLQQQGCHHTSINAPASSALTAWGRVERLFPYLSQPKQSFPINTLTSINGTPQPNFTTKPPKPHCIYTSINSSYTSINSSLPKPPNNLPSVMTRKRNAPTAPPPFGHQNPHNNSLHSTAQPYSPIITTPPPNIQLPPYPPTVQRYQSPPWQHFLDQNPWQFCHLQTLSPQTEVPQDHPQLPLPPQPNHYLWKDRCYNCLKIGHDQNECRAQERVCAKCWTTGHEAKYCTHTPTAKKVRFDPLQPRGNMGDSQLPPNRPRSVTVFIPETNIMKVDALEFNRAIVIDARLKVNHTPEIVQSVLMNICKSDFPFPLTHMSGSQYLLLLPSGFDRHRFLLSYDKPLQDLGYVTYPWTPAVNGYPLRLKYKIWIELRGLSTQMWTIDHLIAAASSIGIVLEHASMTRAPSLESMHAVVAVPELGNIPHTLNVWLKGITREVEIRVLSWLEEPVPLVPPIDTTPTAEFFARVQHENKQAVTIVRDANQGSSVLAIEFDMIFSVWKSMKEGKDKEKLEKTLRTSPLFDAMQNPASHLAVAMVPPPQQEPEKPSKGKEICQTVNLEISSSVSKRDHSSLVIKCPPVYQSHVPATTPTVPGDKTPLSGKPLQISNPIPTTLKPNPTSTANAIQDFATAIANSPPKTINFSPSPLTDKAIGLIRSLPNPPLTASRTPVTPKTKPNNNLLSPTPTPSTSPRPQPTHPCRSHPSQAAARPNPKQAEANTPVLKLTPPPGPNLNNHHHLNTQQSTTNNSPPTPAAHSPAPNKPQHSPFGNTGGFDPDAADPTPRRSTQTQGSPNPTRLLIESDPDDEVIPLGSEPEDAELPIGSEPVEDETQIEPEPAEEPTEYEIEDMQEEDYRAYEEYEDNLQADLSALAQQSSFGHSESEVIGEYITPTASEVDLLMFEAAYGGADQEVAEPEVAPAAAVPELPDQPEPQDDATGPPPPDINAAEQQSLRRSARISVRGFTKNYSPKKSRKKKKVNLKSPFTEADLLKVLQTEALAAAPLDQDHSDNIDRFCGIENLGIPLPHGEGPSNNRQDGIQGTDEEYGESILGDLEFNSEDDKFTDDDEASVGDGH